MGLKLPSADTNFKQKQALLARFAANVWTMMGNAEGLVLFPSPPIALVALIDLINAYTAALGVAVKGSKEDTSNKNIAKAALIGALRSNAMYVTSVAQTSFSTRSGNTTQLPTMQQVILASGYKLSKKPNPVANNLGPALPIVRKAISKSAGTLHLLLRQYTRFKKGTKVWQLQYRTSAHGTTPAGPWVTQVFSSGNITAEGLTSGVTYDWQVGAVGGHNTKLNTTNPVQYTTIRQIVIT